MERRDDDNDICSSTSKLDPIPLDINMTKSPPKELLCRVESSNHEKERRASKADWIPLDLEVDILNRLPEESLIRFQCVSKIWSSIIQSQRFIDSYYAMSLARQTSRYIISFTNILSAKRYDRHLFIFSSSSLESNLDLEIPQTRLAQPSSCTSVHGLIVCKNARGFIVCNPSTKKFTTLPTGSGNIGYDPVNHHFKVMTLIEGSANEQVYRVITLGEGVSSLTGNKVSFSASYYPATEAICINGFVYFGAMKSLNPVVVCFDVRHERMSLIKVRRWWELGKSTLIEYKGKLASITSHSNGLLRSFDLWILEDVENQDWSKQTFELPCSLWRSRDMASPVTNKAGEIIFAPKFLPNLGQPIYIFLYNVERKSIRRVKLQAIADKEFRDRHGIIPKCPIYISPQHGESIAFP